MDAFAEISVVLSCIGFLAVGVQAWPHGSEATCPPGPEPICPYVPSGIHDIKLPHPNNCHYFIHCDAGGQPICKICPAELHFSNVTKNCEWPAEAGCEGAPDPGPGPTPATAPPTTTEPPTTTVSTTVTTPGSGSCHPEPQCPVCDCDGDRTPHPDECEWYFECQDRRLHLHKCRDGFYYSPGEKVCDYACNVNCANSTFGRTAASGSDRCPSTQGRDIPACPDPEPSYNVYFAHPADCGFFFQCTRGVAHCHPCPPGLHWNARLHVCDSPVDAGCSL